MFNLSSIRNVRWFGLVLLFCGSMQAQSLLPKLPPAGPNRPAGVPSNYVITPFGYFHPSCVLLIQKGESIKDDSVLHRADGSTVLVAPCQYPHYMPSGKLAAASGRTSNAAAEQDQEPSTQPAFYHAWVEASDVFTNTSYGKEVSTWTVPPVPLMQEGQTIFFFPGFEDSVSDLSIIQPVIGSWNGFSWQAYSWNCCVSGTVWESNPIAINPGDTIVGTTEMTCPAGTTNCSTWNITTLDQTTGQSTELSNTPSEGQTFNWAFGGVLEAYNVNQCLDYPPNASLTFNSLLYDSNLNLISNPGWNSWIPLDSSVQPQCNYEVSTTDTQTTLTYGTSGPGFGLGINPAEGIAVNQGSSASGTITITDINGFTGLVDVSASNLPAGVTAQISQGDSSNTYTITLTATSSAVLTGANQPATLTLTATGSGVPAQTFPVNVIVNPPLSGGSGYILDLTNAFNMYSFYDDAQASSITYANSLDGSGDVYSANQLSPPGIAPMGLNMYGVQFSFGTPNQQNAVYGTGSNPISLPSGNFDGIHLLGASSNNSQYSQTVIVTYTDNTTDTFTQNFHDWDSNSTSCTSSDPCTGGESVVLTMPYCDNFYNYPMYNRLFYLYIYSYALDYSKTVKSLTLPNNQSVVILAATLFGGISTPALTVTPSAASINANQTLTVTVAVSGGTGNPTPTGSVILTGGGYSNTQTLSNGNTQFNIAAGSLSAGSDTFTANYTPDSSSSSTYAAVTGTSMPVTVSQATQTITFGAIAAQTVGTPLTLSATATSGLPVTFTSATKTICTVSGTKAALIASGTCTINANQAGNNAYAAASQVQQSFKVNGESQTITFGTIAVQTVGTPLTLSATASSGLAVTFTSATQTICTVSGTAATFIASGTCTIDANQAGDSAYAAAPQVQQSFKVNSEGQTITFGAIAAQTVGTPLTLSAAATSGLPVTFTSATQTICTVSGTKAALIASGTCTIDANQAGNNAYAAASQVQQSFKVNGESQTITFGTIAAQTVGTPLTLSATASSGLAVTFTSATQTICTVSGTTATLIAAGACTIDASQSGNSAYAAAPTVSQTFNVTTFTLSGKAVTIAPGATTGNTSTITVTPVSGFTGTVNLSCAISPTAASYPATCSLSPASVAISTGALTSTLTVYSTAPTTCSSMVHPQLPGEPWYAAGGATLACLLIFGIPARRRSWRTMLGVLALLVALSGGVLACGGGGGGGNNCTPNSGTTAGSYSITVTGKSGSTLTVTNTITLTVQ